MHVRLMKTLTSRAAGPLAGTIALALAATLGVAWSSWESDRAALQAKVAELTQQAERSRALWKAQLTACHAAAAGSRRLTEARYAGRELAEADARALLEGAPEGIDACARMESADRAVLSNLR